MQAKYNIICLRALLDDPAKAVRKFPGLDHRIGGIGIEWIQRVPLPLPGVHIHWLNLCSIAGRIVSLEVVGVFALRFRLASAFGSISAQQPLHLK